MFHYYYDLAKLAYKNNDHNTTLIIKCALEHIVIKQLKFKILKSEQKLLNKLIDTFKYFAMLIKSFLLKYTYP